MGILTEVLNATVESKKNGVTPKIYFDLDSTLFDVKPRVKRIISEFGHLESTLAKFPVAAKILRKIEQVAESYHIRDHLKHFGLEEESHELHKDLLHYWNHKFFHSEYLLEDVPYKGAVEYVNRLFGAGAEIVYLTGRDTERMKQGSFESLKKWKFPIDSQNAKLVLKPNKELDDAEFKRDHFLTVHLAGQPIWFFENEPHNIHLILRDCPYVKIIYFESVHSGKSDPPLGLPTIKNFIL